MSATLYVPTLTHPDYQAAASDAPGHHTGEGRPADALGSPGDHYVDLLTGDFYWRGQDSWLPSEE